MSEEFEILKTVTERLDAAGIPYMVTGSMAVNYYGVPRMTRDTSGSGGEDVEDGLVARFRVHIQATTDSGGGSTWP